MHSKTRTNATGFPSACLPYPHGCETLASMCAVLHGDSFAGNSSCTTYALDVTMAFHYCKEESFNHNSGVEGMESPEPEPATESEGTSDTIVVPEAVEAPTVAPGWGMGSCLSQRMPKQTCGDACIDLAHTPDLQLRCAGLCTNMNGCMISCGVENQFPSPLSACISECMLKVPIPEDPDITPSSTTDAAAIYEKARLATEAAVDNVEEVTGVAYPLADRYVQATEAPPVAASAESFGLPDISRSYADEADPNHEDVDPKRFVVDAPAKKSAEPEEEEPEPIPYTPPPPPLTIEERKAQEMQAAIDAANNHVSPNVTQDYWKLAVQSADNAIHHSTFANETAAHQSAATAVLDKFSEPPAGPTEPPTPFPWNSLRTRLSIHGPSVGDVDDPFEAFAPPTEFPYLL